MAPRTTSAARVYRLAPRATNPDRPDSVYLTHFHRTPGSKKRPLPWLTRSMNRLALLGQRRLRAIRQPRALKSSAVAHPTVTLIPIMLSHRWHSVSRQRHACEYGAPAELTTCRHRTPQRACRCCPGSCRLRHLQLFRDGHGHHVLRRLRLGVEKAVAVLHAAAFVRHGLVRHRAARTLRQSAVGSITTSVSCG
jgi:hypothetical protein